MRIGKLVGCGLLNSIDETLNVISDIYGIDCNERLMLLQECLNTIFALNLNILWTVHLS